MIRIRRIGATDALYPQARTLAERVVGERETDRATHALFVAVSNHPTGERVVGCVAVRDGGAPGVGALEWFAVDPQLQGQDLGRRLVAEAETTAFAALRLHRLYCDAPARAKAFLARMGWRESGGADAGDGRVRMEVVADPPSEDAGGPNGAARE